MTPSTWWRIYAAAAFGLLATMAVLGLVDRDWPGRLIGDLKAVTFLSSGAWIAAAVLGARKAMRARPGRSWIAWAGFAAFAFLAAGEEVEWLIEVAQPRREPGLYDLHNRLDDVVSRLTGWGWGASELAVALAWLAMVAGSTLALARSDRLRPLRDHPASVPAVLGLWLLGFALFFEAWTLVDWPYVAGIWTLEECLELLGALAFVGVPVVVADPVTP